MSSRSFVFVGTLMVCLCAATAYAGDLSWQACHAQAGTLCQAGDLEQALERARFALNLARSRYGRDHLNVAKSLERLSEISETWGRLPQSDLYLNEAIAIRTRIQGDCHPSVIRLITVLAEHSRLRRNYDLARANYHLALNLAAKANLSESSDSAPALEGLARLYMDQGDYPNAESLYERAITIYETGGKYRPAEKLCAARGLLDLAEIKRSEKDYRTAQKLYESALAKYSTVAGPSSPMVAYTYKRLADLYVNKQVPSLARTYYERSLAAYGKSGLPEGPLTASTLAGLAGLLKSQDESARSKTLYKAAQVISDRSGGLDRELATTALTKEKLWPSLSRK